MFDKFFTMRKGEKKKVLVVGYGDIVQLTVEGTIENNNAFEKVAYALEVIHNNVPETARWYSVAINQIFQLELKDGESLTIHSEYDIDFHINGQIYTVV